MSRVAVTAVQGFFGKLPGLGDFVRRELPHDFLEKWDGWLQQSIAESKAALGESWLATYLNSPIWRFALSSGVCGDRGWAGIVMPSVDKVGRYFPLTIASSLGDDADGPFRIMADADAWFSAAESLALSVLEQDKVDPDELGAMVAGLDTSVLRADVGRRAVVQGGEWGLKLTGATPDNFSSAICHELVTFQVGAYSLWWSLDQDSATSTGLVTPGLPPPASFASLLNGYWDAAHVPPESDDLSASAEQSGGTS